MPKSKLPKGAQSLSDIAKMRGRGGQLLKQSRKSEFSEHPSEMTDRGMKDYRRAVAGKEFTYRKGLRSELSSVTSNPLKYEKPPVVAGLKVSDIHSARIGSPPINIKKPYDLISAYNLRTIAKAAGKMSAIGQIITLPEQVKEYKQHMKPLSKKEQERSARGI